MTRNGKECTKVYHKLNHKPAAAKMQGNRVHVLKQRGVPSMAQTQQLRYPYSTGTSAPAAAAAALSD
jgi:hypothetical protein